MNRVYIVSYPRSGNTWVRLLLEYALGFKTLSVYQGETRRIFREVTGDDSHITNARKLDLIKTHEFSLAGNDPAIYVLRDGRDATASYWYYTREFEKRETGAFSDFLHSLQSSGNWWADHVYRWLEKIRRNNSCVCLVFWKLNHCVDLRISRIS